jgi:ABC-2 type transport system ATP-binding protein
MDDIEALCQRVVVLSEGKIFFDGQLKNLRKQVLPERRLVVDLLHAEEYIDEPETELIRREGHRVFLSFDPSKTPASELIARICRKHAVADLFVENPPIEEMVAKLYRGKR